MGREVINFQTFLFDENVSTPRLLDLFSKFLKIRLFCDEFHFDFFIFNGASELSAPLNTICMREIDNFRAKIPLKSV